LERTPELANVAPVGPEHEGGPTTAPTPAKKAKTTLASFLNAKNAKNNKTRKFLGAAVWLHVTSGKSRFVTADVTNALRQHNQGSCATLRNALTITPRGDLSSRMEKSST
jgi:hypothetical protein